MKLTKLITRARKVIDSCTTEDQLLVGFNYCYLLVRKPYCEGKLTIQEVWELIIDLLNRACKKDLLSGKPEHNFRHRVMWEASHVFEKMIHKKYDKQNLWHYAKEWAVSKKEAQKVVRKYRTFKNTKKS